jgi:hypothetical protein
VHKLFQTYFITNCCTSGYLKGPISDNSEILLSTARLGILQGRAPHPTLENLALSTVLQCVLSAQNVKIQKLGPFTWCEYYDLAQ